MFRLDFNYIVDATHCGNVARFINHCCDPNSYAKVVRVRGEDHIIIFSRTFIQKGAEIVYDYQFPLRRMRLNVIVAARTALEECTKKYRKKLSYQHRFSR